MFGQLDDALTFSSNYRIRPFAGSLRAGPREFAIDTSEVHELLSVPLGFLRSLARLDLAESRVLRFPAEPADLAEPQREADRTADRNARFTTRSARQ